MSVERVCPCHRKPVIVKMWCYLCPVTRKVVDYR